MGAKSARILQSSNCPSSQVNVRAKRHDGTVNQMWHMLNDDENSNDAGTWTGWKVSGAF
jgi:hypothetical protein